MDLFDFKEFVMTTALILLDMKQLKLLVPLQGNIASLSFKLSSSKVAK